MSKKNEDGKYPIVDKLPDNALSVNDFVKQETMTISWFYAKHKRGQANYQIIVHGGFNYVIPKDGVYIPRATAKIDGLGNDILEWFKSENKLSTAKELSTALNKPFDRTRYTIKKLFTIDKLRQYKVGSEGQSYWGLSEWFDGTNPKVQYIMELQKTLLKNE